MDNFLEARILVEWKAIPGYEGFYEISAEGEVRSIDRIILRRGSQVKQPGKMIKQGTLPKGYKIVSLCRDGVVRPFRVGRLMLTTFVRQPDGSEEACHRDRNPSNNRLGNLRWDTPVGNAADKIEHGTENRGERNHFAVVTAPQVLEIRARLAAGDRGVDLAREFKIRQTTVSAIKVRRSWSHI